MKSKRHTPKGMPFWVPASDYKNWNWNMETGKYYRREDRGPVIERTSDGGISFQIFTREEE